MKNERNYLDFSGCKTKEETIDTLRKYLIEEKKLYEEDMEEEPSRRKEFLAAQLAVSIMIDDIDSYLYPEELDSLTDEIYPDNIEVDE